MTSEAKLNRERRLLLVICISFSFFIAEISVGFYTRSLALVADAFHYLNDLVGFVVAYAAVKISARDESPKELSFGWQRAQLLGAFFNGVFLLALGVSIFLQSIERFSFATPEPLTHIRLPGVEKPKLILIIGCVGLALNIISATFLHEHAHDHEKDHTHYEESTINEAGEDRAESSLGTDTPVTPHQEHRHQASPRNNAGYDLGMLGVLLHVIGDAINNVGVIISALVIWLAHYDGKYYADPGVSMGIAVMILISSIPLVKRSGSILLESVPPGVDLRDIKHDLEKIPGIESVHELHVWGLNQQKTLASAHVVVKEHSVSSFVHLANVINECFHAYGIHSTTLQPELAPSNILNEPSRHENLRMRSNAASSCQITCGNLCESLTCCG
ncbi:hypothetical protein N7451_009055 [Penicillium sp. IBT 35674x]|nr:hypothetical protein N7451_009055 [Penicillium sp. IBT 35674x]